MVHPDNLGYVIIETAATSEIVPTKLIEKRKDGMILAEGVLQEGNKKNRNGRIYDTSDLAQQIIAPRQVELLNSGNMMGENGHPLVKDLTRQQTIDPNNCAVLYRKFWMDGDFVMGQFHGAYTDKGRDFNIALENGDKPSFSLRALGTIKNTMRGAEVKDLKMITYDRVIFPSHDKAYTTGLVSESATMSEDCKLIVDENDPGMVIPITNQSVIDYIKHESLNINQIMESFDLMYDEIKLIRNNSQVQLTDKSGGIFVVNLETHLHNEIMNECMKYVF